MKTNAYQLGAVKPLYRWILLGVAAIAIGLPLNDYVHRQILPFGIDMPSLDGKEMVDPRTPLEVKATGFNAKLAKVELQDESGKVLAEATDQNSVTLSSPLAFGTRHKITATVVRPWFGQSESREIAFTTVTVPKLEGSSLRMLSPDSTVTLNFDQPVGDIQAKSDLHIKAEKDANGKAIKLTASDYAQDHTYPVQVEWQTSTGVPLPPFQLDVTTAPPLNLETNVKGQSNLGLALPVIVNFSEPLAEGTNVSQNIKLKTDAGQEITGKWERQGKKGFRFTPQPGWPASSTIEVSVNQQNLRSARGGTLENPIVDRFTTGTDRKIFVYLDRQRVEAVENGEVVRAFRVSTGKPKTPTVTGNFYIYDRYRHKTMRSDPGVHPGQRGYYQVDDVPYTQFFHKDYAFHGAFWHNGFGHTASHGCVNMATKDKNRRWPNSPEDAGWLFKWASLGVPVTVYGKSPSFPKVEAGNGTTDEGEKKASDSSQNGHNQTSVNKSDTNVQFDPALQKTSAIAPPNPPVQ